MVKCSSCRPSIEIGCACLPQPAQRFEATVSDVEHLRSVHLSYLEHDAPRNGHLQGSAGLPSFTAGIERRQSSRTLLAAHSSWLQFCATSQTETRKETV